MDKELLHQLETPCVVLDTRMAEENIKKMQAACDACGVKLRPHIKTHKMPLFAKMQLAAGADGVTCAKVGEAEVMADGGVDDIFIAYPMVGDFRVRRVIALAKRLRRLILGVDSLEIAKPLSAAAVEAGVTLEVRLEVDTGAKRTGVERDKAAALAVAIHNLPNLNLTGLYTFKSLVYHDAPTLDKCEAAAEEGELMQQIVESIRAAGVPITDISAGSTPHGHRGCQDRKSHRGSPRHLHFQRLYADERGRGHAGRNRRARLCHCRQHP